MLVVTGGEAMYADLGHFGARPIRTSWFAVVYPALLLNYLGQGAYLLSGAPVAGGKLFFSLVPPALLYPMVLLAIVATVIASQALISGVFSLVSQAIRLGLFPRLDAPAHAPDSCRADLCSLYQLGAVCRLHPAGADVRLQHGARPAAYGLAVSGVMFITSLAMFSVARRVWSWSVVGTGVVWGALMAVNAAFLVASSLKFIEGGFVPLSIGVAAFVVMATWRWGRKATFAAYRERHHDHGGTGRDASRLQGFHRAQCAADVAETAAPAERPRAGADADAVGALWHPAAQSDLRRGQPSQGALCQR